MEADWNKLIERYLQNELSAEGKEAFEFEMTTNPELKMEVDLHLMIMGSAIRSAERGEIVAIGKRFHFRRKLSNAAIITFGVVLVAVSTYFLLNDKKQEVSQLKQTENKLENKTETKESVGVCGSDTPFITVSFAASEQKSDPNVILSSEETVYTDLKSIPKETAKSKDTKTKEKDQEVKYLITTIKKTSPTINSSTKEDRPFYLSGNYTSAGDYLIMDTPDGLYMFDTCNDQLFVFKSDYRRKKKKNGETVLFGFKHRRYLTDVYQNGIRYKMETRDGIDAPTEQLQLLQNDKE